MHKHVSAVQKSLAQTWLKQLVHHCSMGDTMAQTWLKHGSNMAQTWLKHGSYEYSQLLLVHLCDGSRARGDFPCHAFELHELGELSDQNVDSERFAQNPFLPFRFEDNKSP